MPFNEEGVSWPLCGHHGWQSASQTTVKYYGSIFGRPNRLARTLTAVASQLWRPTRLSTLAESTRFAPPFGRRSRIMRPLCVSSRPLHAQTERGHTCGGGSLRVAALPSARLFGPLVRRVLAPRARAEISSPSLPEGALRPLSVCRGNNPPRVGLGPLPPPPVPPPLRSLRSLSGGGCNAPSLFLAPLLSGGGGWLCAAAPPRTIPRTSVPQGRLPPPPSFRFTIPPQIALLGRPFRARPRRCSRLGVL